MLRELGSMEGLVNTLNERTTTSAPLALVDPDRRALEARIEQAKNRLVQDLNRASRLVRRAAGTVGRGVLRAAVVGGLIVAALAVAFVRRRHRIRVTWR
jgi:hypothetical protein